jgi:hypothetical protein
MTPEQAIDVITKVFEDAWVGVGLDLENVKYSDVPGQKPAGEVPWARVTVMHATGNQKSLSNAIGKRRFRATGTVIAQIFTPIGDGSVAEYGIAQAVLTAYRIAQDPDVWFRNTRLNERPSEGSFAQTNVLSEFVYDDVI